MGHSSYIGPSETSLIDYDKAVKPLADTLEKIKREFPELYPTDAELKELHSKLNNLDVRGV